MNIPETLKTNLLKRISAGSIACATSLFLVLGCSPGVTDAASPSAHAGTTEMSFRLESAPIIAADKRATASKLRLFAAGTKNARVVDQEHNVLIAAPANGTIFSIEASPDQKHLLLYRGDANYEIVTADTLDFVASLPVKPPAQHEATGFGWRFLTDDYFLGSASLPSTDTAGKTMAEIESLPPRAVLLYVYDWKTGQLFSVNVEETLPAIFFIRDVSDWNVTLLTYDDELVGARIVRSPAAGNTNPP